MTKRLKTLNVEYKQKDLSIQAGIPIYKLEDKKEALKTLNQIFIDASIVYFGIHSSQIQEAVILKASQKIIFELNQISIEEVAYSFERIEIQRQVTLTLDDLINPIRKYIYTKNYILIEAKRLIDAENQEQEEAEATRIYEKEALELYEKSLQLNEWKGTIFHALTLAKKFGLKQKLNPEKILEFWEQTKIDYYEIQKQIKEEKNAEITNFIANLGKTPERIFAEKIIIECIKQKIEL